MGTCARLLQEEIRGGAPAHIGLAHALGNRIPQKTLVFAASVAHAERFSEILNRWLPNSSRWICGTTPKEERRSTLKEYSADKFSFIVNVGVATEGFDEPGIQIVSIARATKSRALYCLDEKTEILTPSGWRQDIKAGDLVAGFNPATNEIEYVPALATIRRDLQDNEHFVSISGPSIDIRVTDQHRLLYDNNRKTGWKFRPAIEVATLRDTNYIPVAGFMPKPGLPLSDDELKFIGWVMTDGTINKHNNAITITQGAHQPWLEQIESCIKGCGLKFTRGTRIRKTVYNQNSDCVYWTISKGAPRGRDKHLRGWGYLECYLSKDFTPELMNINERQFDVLAEAIHLGDGHKQRAATWTQRSYHISKGNQTFIERLQICALMNGWRANMATSQYCGNPIYTLHMKKQNWCRVGGSRLDRPCWQIEPYKPEQCWCVENSHGTLITRRNGKVAIVGNCQMIGRGTRPLPGLVDDEDSAEMRRLAISCSAKPTATILDFLGNAGKHKLVTTADILGGNYEEAVVARAKKKAEEAGETGRQLDIGQALEESERELKDMEQKAERARRSRLLAAGGYRTESVSPFDVLHMRPWKEKGWDKGKPISDKMSALLARQGINTTNMSYTEARQITQELFRRWEGKLCTFKQAKLLQKRGYDTRDLTMAEAKKLIDDISAKEGWASRKTAGARA